MDDIIAAIDTAVGCQQCGKSLERSVSDDFCGEGCQQAWHTTNVGAKADPLCIPHFTHAGRTITVGRDAELYRLDGGNWVPMGTVAAEFRAHFEIQEDGSVVDNMAAIRLREIAGNVNVRGWIDPEVWGYLREGEGL